MPHLMIFGRYATICIIAVMVGLLIAAVFRTTNLPTAVAATPTSAQIRAVATIAPAPTSLHSLSPTIGDATSPVPASATPVAPIVVSEGFPTPIKTPATSPQETASAAPPLSFGVRIFDRPTDAAVACGTSFESRIWGVVKDKNGRGIYRAVVQDISADGKNHYSRSTNTKGGFEVPGLGCTTWRIRLIALPGAPNGFRADAISIGLNGGRYSGAGVEFRQR